MKAVLVGADLMYRKDGSLAPIEINTNVGWDNENRVEPVEDIFQLEVLGQFVKEHGIKKLKFLPGSAQKILSDIEGCQKYLSDVEIETVLPENTDQVEDSDDCLIIRTTYSDEALVDAFCRDKIAFLNSLKGTDLAAEYILKTADGLEGRITSVETEYPAGIPNFVVKYRYPNYNKKAYPKFCRFETLEELQDFAENKLDLDYFIMPFYFCKNELYEGNRIKLVREWSFFIVNEEGGLDSVHLGRYTKVCANLDKLDRVRYDKGELVGAMWFRKLFTTTDWFKTASKNEQALLDKGDLVWMSDGSWKTIEDVREGDIVKSLEIPAKPGYVSEAHRGYYGVTVEELSNETHYVENRVTRIKAVARFDEICKLKFTDGTDWYDTSYSSYPIVNRQGLVQFKLISDLKVGTQVILLSLNNSEKPEYVVKELESVEIERNFVQGYGLELDGSHLFISRTFQDEAAYAAIEHNESSVDMCYDPVVFLGVDTSVVPLATSNLSYASLRSDMGPWSDTVVTHTWQLARTPNHEVGSSMLGSDVLPSALYNTSSQGNRWKQGSHIYPILLWNLEGNGNRPPSYCAGRDYTQVDMYFGEVRPSGSTSTYYVFNNPSGSAWTVYAGPVQYTSIDFEENCTFVTNRRRTQGWSVYTTKSLNAEATPQNATLYRLWPSASITFKNTRSYADVSYSVVAALAIADDQDISTATTMSILGSARQVAGSSTRYGVYSTILSVESGSSPKTGSGEPGYVAWQIGLDTTFFHQTDATQLFETFLERYSYGGFQDVDNGLLILSGNTACPMAWNSDEDGTTYSTNMYDLVTVLDYLRDEYSNWQEWGAYIQNRSIQRSSCVNPPNVKYLLYEMRVPDTLMS